MKKFFCFLILVFCITSCAASHSSKQYTTELLTQPDFRYSIDVKELGYTFYSPKNKINDLHSYDLYEKGTQVNVKLFQISTKKDLTEQQMKLAVAEIAEQEGYTKLIITKQESSRACETYNDYKWSQQNSTFYQGKNNVCAQSSSLYFIAFNDYNIIKNGLLYAFSVYGRKSKKTRLYHDLYIPLYEDTDSSSEQNGVEFLTIKDNDAYTSYYDVAKMKTEYMDELNKYGDHSAIGKNRKHIYKIDRKTENDRTYGLVIPD